MRTVARSTWVVAAVVAAAAVSAVPPAVAAAGPGGTSAADAAASCWEIKQNDPSAGDGEYWLQTPQLVAPDRFYCDMTTDGGGWVLVGRGREDWRPEYQGQGGPGHGTTAGVRSAVTGPGAFGVQTLPSTTVDDLLGGQRVDALPDGVRLRRAMNTAGTTWQEARFAFANRDRWTWAFGANQPLDSYAFDGTSHSGGDTANFGTGSAYNRVDTRESKAQGYRTGWAYGSSVSGSDAGDSYLWSARSGLGGAEPFTQMFLRPKLRSSDLSYPQLPDSGTAAQARTPLLQSGAEPQQWGVTGRATPTDNEHYTEAQTATQIGDTVFVGGNFANVQQGADGQQVDQSDLAGFDVHTGAWRSSFRPTFDGQVKALAPLPNGDLVAAGQFSEVNGTPAVGIVALDPSTGEVDPDWSVAMENRVTGGTVHVDTAARSGDWLYLGGSFTHLKGGNQSAPVFARNAARVSLADGTADGRWNPNFNGTVYDVDVGQDAQRFYAVGHMTMSNQTQADSFAAVSTAAGAGPISGLKQPRFSHTRHYQQTVLETGDRVWIGGSEHSLFSYDRSDLSSLSGNITKPGGDFQASVEADGTVYAGCHCTAWNYEGADTWPNPGRQWTEGDKVSFVGAWNAATGRFEPEFNPWLNATRNQGLWGAFRDSTGTVWMLGDFSRARRNDGGFQWVGGFARFAPRDTTPPGTPSNLSVDPVDAQSAKLSWGASSDNRGAVRYEVLRDDRVIATTTQTGATVPTGGAHRFAVRAVDAGDNRSASTPVREVGG